MEDITGQELEKKEVIKQKYKRLPLSNDNSLLDLGSIRIKSPQNLVIVKYPKSGTTLSMVNVPKILIADAEDGTAHFPANNKVNLLDPSVENQFVTTKKYGWIPKTIHDLVTELYQANDMKGYWELRNKFDIERDLVVKQGMYEELVIKINSMPFPIVNVDTITSIVGISNSAALYEFNLGVKPDSQKADAKRIDEYGGVQYIRRKFSEIKNFIEQNAAPFIIYSGHIALRKKVVRKGEEDISAIDIALDGVLSTIFTAKADAVCVFHREDDGCYLDFKKKDESDMGSRPFHLSNKKIKVAEIMKGDQETPITHWGLIYPEIECLQEKIKN